ncbi:hypothetical protein RRG08_038364 [Elysia crispata]|uniref:Uncharacterized protein n=1 Tax=Elysia crispata TaxID=231223 RepID=A0AAE0Z163_9GAST|nr:hypothetical protein RRG08_038364 [Elysia crispata]
MVLLAWLKRSMGSFMSFEQNSETAPSLVSICGKHQGDTCQEDDSRTKKFCETWDNSLQQLVGHHHLGVWTIVECLRIDEAQAATKFSQAERGEPSRKKRKKSIQQH